jgi:hypothetical protein
MLWIALVPAGALRADFARDVARIHTEATGGREQIDALKSFKATGVTSNERGEMPFIMWAARPSSIRIEVKMNAQTITQGWDGEQNPWTTDPRTKRVIFLSGQAAEDFKAEAEFDDPLLAGPDRKVALDYVGVVEEDGQKRIKIMVTQNFTAVSFVYLDAATYLIVRRDVVRRRGVTEMVLRTDYSDFREVAGVVLPHRMIVTAGGKRVRETVIDVMQANPQVAEGFFAARVSALASP